MNAFTNNPALATSHPVTPHTTMHFYPQGEMIESVPSHIPQENLVDVTDNNCPFISHNPAFSAQLGWNMGVIGHMAAGSSGRIRIRAHYHYNVSVRNPTTGQLPVMNNAVTAASPAAYGAASTLIAQSNMEAVNTGYNRAVVQRNTAPSNFRAAADPKGPIESLFDVPARLLDGLVGPIINDVRFNI